MQTLSLIILLGLASIIGQQPALSPPAHTPHVKMPASQQLAHLRAITVRILAKEQPIGSGVILSVQAGWYTVITNSHVLRSRSQPWQIQTVDRKIYLAESITPPAWAHLDLALLKFRAVNATYPVAKINAISRLKVGDPVTAGGFPLNPNSQIQPDLQGFVVSRGQVTYILTKPLVEGYQIGYTNPIHKGMSGGPLLNQQGELVGINGIHDQPLWSAPETFADGTSVPEALQSQIGKFSWAIPAQTAPSN